MKAIKRKIDAYKGERTATALISSFPVCRKCHLREEHTELPLSSGLFVFSVLQEYRQTSRRKRNSTRNSSNKGLTRVTNWHQCGKTFYLKIFSGLHTANLSWQTRSFTRQTCVKSQHTVIRNMADICYCSGTHVEQ